MTAQKQGFVDECLAGQMCTTPSKGASELARACAVVHVSQCVVLRQDTRMILNGPARKQLEHCTIRGLHLLTLLCEVLRWQVTPQIQQQVTRCENIPVT